ncbi:hypothetical protein D3C73_1113090 [compost metagenome]
MIKHSPADRTIALQVLDDAHALDQLLATGLEITDLLDPLVDHGDLSADVIITRKLPLDGAADDLVGEEQRTRRAHQYTDQHQ